MSAIEREVKLGAWPGLALPDLTDIIDGGSVLAMQPQRLTSVYVDTPDLRLARWGVTVRHRSAAPAPSAGGLRQATDEGWTVKLPAEEAGVGLARHELQYPGGEAKVPAGVVHLLRALVRGASLVPVARLRTDRLRFQIRDATGHGVVEIDDDEVSVLVPGLNGRGRRIAARFREIEVELLSGGSPQSLEAVVARLRAAGAGEPDPTPKVVRALGPRAVEPPEVVAPTIDERATTADVIRAAIAGSVARLLTHDPGVRLGDDPEDVHQARVATRRLRSDLRTFRAALDPSWTEDLRAELGWVAGLLGAVRDADVLLERLTTQSRALAPIDEKAAGGLLRRLEGERHQARDALLAALDSERYAELLERLVLAASTPRLAQPAVPALELAPIDALVAAGGVGVLPPPAPLPPPAVLPPAAPLPPFEPSPGNTPPVTVPSLVAVAAPPVAVPPVTASPATVAAPLGDQPARDVVTGLVRRPWRHLRNAVAALGVAPADEALHRVRITAKRCRYAAEAAAPVAGKRAERFADAVADLQGILGDLNDAVVAEAWLRQVASRAPATQAMVAGQLIAAQRAAAEDGRRAWKAKWKRASSKRLRTWMRPR